MSALHRVEIVAPSDSWPDEFRRMAQDLRASLGDLALRIDRIGSTSVPGLSAKNVIDVQLTVAILQPAAIPCTINRRNAEPGLTQAVGIRDVGCPPVENICQAKLRSSSRNAWAPVPWESLRRAPCSRTRIRRCSSDHRPGRNGDV